MKLSHKNKIIKRKNGRIVKMLMPSLIGICVCVICFLGTTFAWFTDNVSISIQTMESASYSLNITIEGGDYTLEDNKGVYTLSLSEKGKKYKVHINPTGTAEKGFCIINDEFIAQINKGEEFTLDLYPETDNEKYIFISIWGDYSTFKNGDYSKYIEIKDGRRIGTPSGNSYSEEVNNNKVTHNVEKVEQNNPQPEKTETTTPSEEATEENPEEENEIMENNLSYTDNENHDTP